MAGTGGEPLALNKVFFQISTVLSFDSYIMFSYVKSRRRQKEIKIITHGVGRII